jgi:hypothetical protein
MNDATTNTLSATLVKESKRLSILPRFFGPKLMMRGENLVYGWLGSLSQDYTGGYWHFYTLSNGGFYMAPASSESFHLVCSGNYFEGDLSADAAGIVATLFALCQLAGEAGTDQLIDLYHNLRDFAGEHAEASAIFAAID